MTPPRARGRIEFTKPGSSAVELDEADYHALGLAIGDRVIVESRSGDVTTGHVSAPRVVTIAIGFGAIGHVVTVRRPRP